MATTALTSAFGRPILLTQESLRAAGDSLMREVIQLCNDQPWDFVLRRRGASASHPSSNTTLWIYMLLSPSLLARLGVAWRSASFFWFVFSRAANALRLDMCIDVYEPFSG